MPLFQVCEPDVSVQGDVSSSLREKLRYKYFIVVDFKYFRLTIINYYLYSLHSLT